MARRLRADVALEHEPAIRLSPFIRISAAAAHAILPAAVAALQPAALQTDEVPACARASTPSS